MAEVTKFSINRVGGEVDADPKRVLSSTAWMPDNWSRWKYTLGMPLVTTTSVTLRTG